MRHIPYGRGIKTDIDPWACVATFALGPIEHETVANRTLMARDTRVTRMWRMRGPATL